MKMEASTRVNRRRDSHYFRPRTMLRNQLLELDEVELLLRACSTHCVMSET